MKNTVDYFIHKFKNICVASRLLNYLVNHKTDTGEYVTHKIRVLF
jgi:hypothetical protein